MEKTICGANCTQCPQKKECRGCAESGGCPFGKPCFVAAYRRLGGQDAYQAFVQTLVDEVNALAVPGMAPITELVPLLGRFINLAYPLPNGARVPFLDENDIYLGAQVGCTWETDTPQFFGVVAAPQFLLVSSYGLECTDPEILLYKKR